MKQRVLSIFIISLTINIFLLSCDVLNHNSEGALGDVQIFTDQEQYLLPSEEWQGMPEVIDQKIRVHLRNESKHPIFMSVPSKFVTLEKKEGNMWRDLDVWYSLIAVAPRIKKIASGEELSPVIDLGLTDEIIEGPGVYRFKFTLYTEESLDEQKLLPTSNRVSNTFEIIDK